MVTARRAAWPALLCLALLAVTCDRTLAGCWERGPSIPGPRAGAAAAVLDGALYVFGGDNGNCAAHTGVYRYPLGKKLIGGWEEMTPLPASWTGGAIAVVGDRIFLLGGEVDSKPSSAVWAYTPSLEGTDEDPWDTSFPAIGSPLDVTLAARPAAGVVDGRVYIFGGGTATTIECGLTTWTPLDAVWQFDPEIKSWEAREALPGGPATDLSAAVIGDKVYVTGGDLSGGVLLSAVRAYEPSTDTWDTAFPDMPSPLACMSALSFDGDLIVVGGQHDVGLATAEVWRLHETAGEWQQLPDLPGPTALAAAAAAGNYLYVVGGQPEAEGELLDGFQALDLRRFHASAADAVFGYDLESGEGTTSIPVLIEEPDDCYPDGPGLMAAGSFALSISGFSLEISGASLGAALEALNGGAGPEIFLVDLCFGGVTVSFVGSTSVGDATIDATAPQEIVLLEVSTVPIVLGGDTGGDCADVSWVSNPCGADPAVDNGIVVGGFEETLVATDFEVCAFPLEPFVRSDCSASGGLSLADPIFLLTYLFRAGPVPRCDDACDGNDDDRVNIGDAIHALRFLFSDGPGPPAPYPVCGFDTTEDALDCESTSSLCD